MALDLSTAEETRTVADHLQSRIGELLDLYGKGNADLKDLLSGIHDQLSDVIHEADTLLEANEPTDETYRPYGISLTVGVPEYR